MELIGNIAPVSLIAYGSNNWRYKDDGSNQGTAWQAAAFNDGTWKLGVSKFGYGDPATTVVYSGCPPSNYPAAENSAPGCGTKFITTYFRKTFNITGLANYSSFTFNVIKDDGYVIYINGNEAARSNMPGGTITYTTGASIGLGKPGRNNSCYL
ncbi:MAG: hypothetical protein IPL04_16995 [Chitinophagaceae bacterium]|nr:hypothetical protein [Chitinophagaceae bacterium]